MVVRNAEKLFSICSSQKSAETVDMEGSLVYVAKLSTISKEFANLTSCHETCHDIIFWNSTSPPPPPKKKQLFFWILSNDVHPNFILQHVPFFTAQNKKTVPTQLISNLAKSLPTSKSFTEEIWSWDPSLAEAFEFCRRNCRMQLSSESWGECLLRIFGGTKKGKGGLGYPGWNLGDFWGDVWILNLPSIFFWAKTNAGLGYPGCLGNLLEMFIQTTIKRKGSLLNNQSFLEGLFQKAHVVQFFLHHNRWMRPSVSRGDAYIAL